MKLSDGYCKLCYTARETLDHILIKCSHISDVWVRREQMAYFLGETDYMTDFNKIIGYMKDGKLHEVIDMILSLSRWIIWKRRCINRYEGEYIDVESLVKWILHEIKNHIQTIMKCKNFTEYKTLLSELSTLISRMLEGWMQDIWYTLVNCFFILCNLLCCCNCTLRE